MNKLSLNSSFASFLFVLVAFTISYNSVVIYGQNKINKSIRKPMTVAQAIQLNRGSIVQIIAKLTPEQMATPGNPIVVLGSGFIVSEGYAVTARHVVTVSGIRPDQIKVAFPSPDSENIRGMMTYTAIEIVEQDEQHDIALLRFSPTKFNAGIVNEKRIIVPKSIAKLDVERPQDGTQVATSGYPLNITVLVSSVGWIASSWNIDTSQLANTTNNQIPQFSDSYLLDMTVNKGNSGGPVYATETGKIVGVCVAFQPARVEGAGNAPLSYNSGVSIAVPIKYVVDILKKHNIKINR